MKGLVMVTTGASVEMRDLRGPGAFDQLMKLELESAEIYLNQPLFLPGLLQTTDYAAGMIGAIAGLRPGDPELASRVQVRMQRAESFWKRLNEPQPPQLWVPIDEAVLRHVVGGRDVMRQQVEHLLEVAALGTVHLGIISMSNGAHRGLGGSFEVHVMADGQASAFFEGIHSDEIIGVDQGVPQRYRHDVESMMSSAVSGPDARAELERIRNELR